MGSDAETVQLVGLARRPPDQLFALAGTADEPDLGIDAIVRLLDPPAAESLEADGLLPQLPLDIAALRQRGRERVEQLLRDRRNALQDLICPLYRGRDGRSLIVTLGPAVLIDITTFGGVPLSSGAQAIVALILTRYVDELCSNWRPPDEAAPPSSSIEAD